MKELKNKFIEAIKSIDFDKLSIYELKIVSEISESIDNLDKKDYVDMLVKTLSSEMPKDIIKPKTLSELKQEVL